MTLHHALPPLPRHAVALGLLLGLPLAAPAEPPLHERIDRLIAAGTPAFAARAAPPAADAEFLRRVYLDLAGTIPSAAEARAFLDERSPDKRPKIIDRLLTGPAFPRRLQDVFDVMLMERRRDKHVPRAAWREFLRSSFAANKPWDQLVREILQADGADPRLRPAAKFYLDRGAEPNLLTRDIGRLFLGMDLQCAQCHDHPVVADYKQADYYGILAFFNRTFLVTDPTRRAVVAEKAEGEVSYQSVFDPGKVTKSTGPRLPGRPPVKEPKFAPGQGYATAPAGAARSVPKFSRRAHLAVQLTDAQNDRFARNSANRLWALLLGRGLVHPVDLDHSANPPSHPGLLALLARELAAMKFDLRAFVRELALSQTYQRASELRPGGEEVPPQSFAIALLKPLSPEQLAWSMMQATGLADAERRVLGKGASEPPLYDRLAGNVAPFVAAFGSRPGQPEGQDFQATLEQALFLRNGSLVRSWLAPRPETLTDRLLRLQAPDAAAEELYLSVLTRRPNPEERQEVAAYLRNHPKDQPAALQELVWALLASAEFRFNH